MHRSMPSYRIFQLRKDFVQPFQDKAPKAGCLTLRDSRYDEVGVITADSPYEAWLMLRQESRTDGVRELGVGDALQTGDEAPLICAWWGFESAEWMSAAQEGAIPVEAEEAVAVSS